MLCDLFDNFFYNVAKNSSSDTVLDPPPRVCLDGTLHNADKFDKCRCISYRTELSNHQDMKF